MVRGAYAIAGTTAREILSEPLSLLLSWASLAVAVLAPAFHYHQFGEATRMARDAGLSALFLGGAAVAVFCTIRSFRREVETGTMSMALAHPVSRTTFFFAKALGCMRAYLTVALTVASTSLVVYEGAAIGGSIAASTGDVARIWGPCLAAGVAVVLVPMVAAAALNRFFRFRFVLTSATMSFYLSLVLGAAALAIDAVRHDGATRLFAADALIALTGLALVASSAALAVRLKANAAAASVGVLVALSLPFAGNYYLADALSEGGRVGWSYVGLAALAIAPLVALFAWLGTRFVNSGEVS